MVKEHLMQKQFWNIYWRRTKMINFKRNKEKTKEELLIENQENTIKTFEDKIAKLQAIFQVNNYGNNKLMLDKIREIIYEQ